MATRPIGVLFGLQATYSAFSTNPVYREIADLPFDERLAALLEPERRERLLAAEGPDDAGRFASLYELGDPPDYEQPPERSIAGRALAEGRAPAELAYDSMVADGGTGFLYFPFANYVNGDFSAILEMMQHPLTLIGLGDGGAHVGTICDGSNVTTMLTHWVRDRTAATGSTSPGRSTCSPAATPRRWASSTEAWWRRASRPTSTSSTSSTSPCTRPRCGSTCRPVASGCSNGPTATWPPSCRARSSPATACPPARSRAGCVRGSQPAPVTEGAVHA